MKKEKSFNAVNLTRDFYKVHRRARGGGWMGYRAYRAWTGCPSCCYCGFRVEEN